MSSGTSRGSGITLSAPMLKRGAVLLPVGIVGAMLSNIAAFTSGNALVGVLFFAMLVVALAGLIYLLRGIYFLADNVDYIAVREAQRRRDEAAVAPSAVP